MKLTKAQRDTLDRVARDSYADGSGSGLIIHDHIEAAVASRLHDKGLVTLPAGHGWIYGSMNGVKITDAGRAALKDTTHAE